jgi:membrane peptidoglycan carboxypeptidase
VIERVRSAGGKLIYRARNPGLGRVIDERSAAMMNQMMQETLASGTATKANLAFPAAGKTGTSQDFRDAWFVGYTGHLIAGVWLGNDDNSPTKKLTGGGMPVDIWSRFMKAAHQGLPMADLPGMTGRTIDPVLPSVPAPAPQSSAPLTSMLAPAAPLTRDDAMRPVAPLTRPPAVAAAPIPQPQPRATAPAGRPPQAMAARVTTAPQPVRTVQLPPPPRPAQVAVAPRMPPSAPPPQMQPPLQLSTVPRPPGTVGAQQEARVQQAAANNNSRVSGFFENLFGQR